MSRTNPFIFYYFTALAIAVLVFAGIHTVAAFGLLPSYIIALSCSDFFLCGLDKNLAVSGGGSRVPERVLVTTALLGGSLGLLMGMGIFRHKTKKASLQIRVILIVVLQILLLRVFATNL